MVSKDETARVGFIDNIVCARGVDKKGAIMTKNEKRDKRSAVWFSDNVYDVTKAGILMPESRGIAPHLETGLGGNTVRRLHSATIWKLRICL